jgi:hypothetical protein
MPLVIVGSEEDIALVLETLSLDSRSSAFDANLRGKIKDLVDKAVIVPIGENHEKTAE